MECTVRIRLGNCGRTVRTVMASATEEYLEQHDIMMQRHTSSLLLAGKFLFLPFGAGAEERRPDLAVQNGWYVHNGRAIRGDAQYNGWWRAGQRANLKLICSLGVDGLEGVAYPPLGDVTLVEAMEMTSVRFIITGGISAVEIENLTSRAQLDEYLGRLFEQMRPYRHRFMLSASCNTPINTTFEQIKWYRDAWEKIQ